MRKLSGCILFVQVETLFSPSSNSNFSPPEAPRSSGNHSPKHGRGVYHGKQLERKGQFRATDFSRGGAYGTRSDKAKEAFVDLFKRRESQIMQHASASF